MWFRFEPTVKNNFKTVSVEVLALLRILRVAVCRFFLVINKGLFIFFRLLVQLTFETPAKYHQKSILVITFP